MKIKAEANLNNQNTICYGEIEIHWIKEPQAYVTWRLYDGENLIASKSENYFYQNNFDSESILIDRIIFKIENYKIGRKTIFMKVNRC
jgi:hypothetical protein